MRSLRTFILSLLVLCAFVIAHGDARAQTQPQTVSTAELEKLVGTLENEAERQRFIEQLKALIEAERRTAPEEKVIPDHVATRFLGGLSEQVAAFGASIMGAAAFVADAPKLVAWFKQQAENEWWRQQLAEIVWKVLAALVCGWIAEWIALRLLGRPLRTLETRAVGGGWARTPYAVLHALVALVPILVFAFVAFMALGMFQPSRTATLVAGALIKANLIARAIALVAWTILAPNAAPLRLVPFGDENANYLYIWVRRLASISIYGYFLAEAALLIGMPVAGYDFLLKLLGVIVSLLLVVLALQNRTNVREAIRNANGAQPGLLRRRFSDLWHVLAVLYVLLVCFIWLVQPDGGLAFVARATGLTFVIALAALAATAILRGLVGLVFRLTNDVRRRFPTLELRANQYLHIVNVVIGIIVYGFAALAIFQVWGFGSLEWLTTPFGQRIGSGIASIGVTIAIALAAWEATNALLDRYLARALGGGIDDLRRAARVRTLMPLLQKVLFGVLALFVGLIVLSEIGINIAPLLAGAGVVGIAVGFGAQALMKDLFGGLSIILEDSIAVGDIVGIGDKGGVVEWMSLRVMRLRDFDGTLHTIPFGEVQTISNRTKDFAFAVFRIAVPHGTDIAKVQRVVREIGAEMRAHPDFGPMIIEDIELHGVDSFGESSMIVLARFKVYPAKQWTITRNFNVLLKQAFDREGLEIALPRRVVRMVDESTAPKVAETAAAGPSQEQS